MTPTILAIIAIYLVLVLFFWAIFAGGDVGDDE